jgi:hypothetical protein
MIPRLVCSWREFMEVSWLQGSEREKSLMFIKGAAIDQGRSCVPTILYTRVCLRIPTINFPMCLGP